MPIKETTIDIPIYSEKFTLLIYNEPDEFKERFKDVPFNCSIEEFDGGVFWINESGKERVYMMFKRYLSKDTEYPTPGIIAHECKHLVNLIFKGIKMHLDRDNDEAECYLLGWLVDRVHENFWKLETGT